MKDFISLEEVKLKEAEKKIEEMRVLLKDIVYAHDGRDASCTNKAVSTAEKYLLNF